MSALIQQITIPNPRPDYADVHVTLHQWPGVNSALIYQVMAIDSIGYCRNDERFDSLEDARVEFARQISAVESEFKTETSPA